MEQILANFAAYLVEQDRSEHTQVAYRQDVAVFFKWLAEQIGRAVPPVEVTTFDVQRYRDYLVDELERKPAGVNRRLVALRVFFDWAMQEKLASTNPAEGVKGIGQDRRQPKALTAQQMYKLQRTAAVQRQLAEARANGLVTSEVVSARCDEALLALLLYTGLRVGEAVRLRVQDVIINERSGTVIVWMGKGKKYREVPLHKEARHALSAYLKVRPKGKDENVFIGQRGALGERSLQVRLAALGEKAKVKVTPHVLRHTFGTRLLREVKTDLVTIAKLMGHSNIATTMLYTQPSDSDMAEAVEKL
jgi:integrase/recombinase XerC